MMQISIWYRFFLLFFIILLFDCVMEQSQCCLCLQIENILFMWCNLYRMNPFAHIATNQKAVAERGWGPLNYNVLLHPEIKLKIPQICKQEAINNQPASSIPPSGLNLSQRLLHWSWYDARYPTCGTQPDIAWIFIFICWKKDVDIDGDVRAKEMIAKLNSSAVAANKCE